MASAGDEAQTGRQQHTTTAAAAPHLEHTPNPPDCQPTQPQQYAIKVG